MSTKNKKENILSRLFFGTTTKRAFFLCFFLLAVVFFRGNFISAVKAFSTVGVFFGPGLDDPGWADPSGGGAPVIDFTAPVSDISPSDPSPSGSRIFHLPLNDGVYDRVINGQGLYPCRFSDIEDNPIIFDLDFTRCWNNVFWKSAYNPGVGGPNKHAAGIDGLPLNENGLLRTGSSGGVSDSEPDSLNKIATRMNVSNNFYFVIWVELHASTNANIFWLGTEDAADYNFKVSQEGQKIRIRRKGTIGENMITGDLALNTPHLIVYGVEEAPGNCETLVVNNGPISCESATFDIGSSWMNYNVNIMDQNYRGVVYSVSMFDRRLTDAEIRSIWNEGLGWRTVDLDDDGWVEESAAPTNTLAENVARFGGDCNDYNENAHGAGNMSMPGITVSATAPPDICDNVDNDCDGEVDEDDPKSVYWPDRDGDNYGDSSAETLGEFCASGAPANASVNNTDCNDTSVSGANIHPGATELCDGIDNDCDALHLGVSVGSNIDEDWKSGAAVLGSACSVGSGTCSNSGTRACASGSDGLSGPAVDTQCMSGGVVQGKLAGTACNDFDLCSHTDVCVYTTPGNRDTSTCRGTSYGPPPGVPTSCSADVYAGGVVSYRCTGTQVGGVGQFAADIQSFACFIGTGTNTDGTTQNGECYDHFAINFTTNPSTNPANVCQRCNADTQTTWSAAPSTTSCDTDGDVCTVEQCGVGTGTCSVSTPYDCSAGSISCAPSGGTCQDDGTGNPECNILDSDITAGFCLIGNTCVDDGGTQSGSGDGLCSVCNSGSNKRVYVFASSDASCDDALFCNGVATCNGSGTCVAGTNPCPAGTDVCAPFVCSEATESCTRDTPSGNPCQDGNACTGGAPEDPDTCNGAGTCTAGGTSCPDPDLTDVTTYTCNPGGSSGYDCVSETITCTDPVTGAPIAHGAPMGPCAVCDASIPRPVPGNVGGVCANDGNVCTVDRCNAYGVCVKSNLASGCADDGNACSQDICNDGVCSHNNYPDAPPRACDDGNDGTNPDTCQAGTCKGPGREICGDGLDNDADGLVDLADPACECDPARPTTWTSCGTDVGECVAGRYSCNLDGTWVRSGGAITCVGQVGPISETDGGRCGDGKDNDCNNLIDDGSNVCGGCRPTPVGISENDACESSADTDLCSPFTLPSDNDRWRCGTTGVQDIDINTFACTTVNSSLSEVCDDGIDNDCFGGVDDGCSPEVFLNADVRAPAVDGRRKFYVCSGQSGVRFESLFIPPAGTTAKYTWTSAAFDVSPQNTNNFQIFIDLRPLGNAVQSGTLRVDWDGRSSRSNFDIIMSDSDTRCFSPN